MAAVTTAIAIGAIASAGASAYSANRQASSARTSARYQADASNRAGEIESRGFADALAFQREQEATRRGEFERTQALNRSLYDEEQRYTRDQDAFGRQQVLGRQQRMAPFHQAGVGALSQLGQPIPRQTRGMALSDLLKR